MSSDELCLDLVECHGRSVNDSRIVGAMREKLRGDQGAREEAYRAAREQVAAANRDEVGRAGSGTDEVDGHSVSAGAQASAQVTGPIATRGPRSRDVGPAPARAAASATE